MVKGEPLVIVEMLSNSQPEDHSRTRGLASQPSSWRWRSWAALTLKAWATSKLDGPFSGWVSKGFCGRVSARAPVEPVPPTTALESSRDFDQV